MKKRPLEIGNAINRVFPFSNGFPDWVPAKAVEARGLLYPAWPLRETQVRAVARAAAEVGEESCYLSCVDRASDQDALQDFELATFSVERYRELGDAFSLLEHVVVSQAGSWGVFVQHDGAAVVAGPGNFVRSVYESLSPVDEQAAELAAGVLALEIPKYETWLGEFLDEILGSETAARVIGSARSA